MSTEPEEVESPSGLKVKCLITGKPGYLGAAILVGKLEEYGTLDEVAKHYICRPAGKCLRDGLSQLETRTSLGLDNNGYVPVDEQIIERALGTKRKKTVNESNKTYENGEYFWQRADFKVKPGWNTKGGFNVEETTKDTCLRPDIYLDDYCEPCQYFSRCNLPIKRIKGKVPKIEKIDKV